MTEQSPHRWEIRKNKAGKFVGYFLYRAEVMWWTEAHERKRTCQAAIDSIKDYARLHPKARPFHADEYQQPKAAKPDWRIT